MTPDAWREVERIYHAALARPASERAAFVASACAGDAAVQREVESPFAHAGDASAFLETTAAASEPTADDVSTRSGSTGRSRNWLMARNENNSRRRSHQRQAGVVDSQSRA